MIPASTASTDYSQWRPKTDSTLDLRLARFDTSESIDALITQEATAMDNRLTAVETQGSFISKVGLQALSEKSPNIQKLNLCCAHGVGDSALEVISKFPELSDLNLHFARNETHCLQLMGSMCRVAPGQMDRVEKITDAGVKHIVEGCPKLKTLDLSGTDITVQTLDLINSKPNIIALRINCVWNVTVDEMEAFKKRARPNLVLSTEGNDPATNEFMKLVHGVKGRFYEERHNPDRSISCFFKPGVEETVKPFINLSVFLNP